MKLHRSPSFPVHIATAAAAWIELRDAGQITEEKEAEFLAWMEADERHVAAFHEFDRFVGRTASLAALKPLGGAPDPDLLGPVPTPAVAPAVMNAGIRIRWGAWAAGIAALAAALAIGFFLWPKGLFLETTPAVQAILTAVGEPKTVTLADGSVVRLNTGSELEIDLRSNERRIQLRRGEAHFAVAKDSVRPFIVAANHVAVRAVGTAFNVRLAPAAVEVLVTEGRVRVDDRTSGASLLPVAAVTALQRPEPLLEAGHKALIPTDAVAKTSRAEVVPVAPTEIERALVWQVPILEFDATPLKEVVAQFNRYNRHQLVITDERLQSRHFTGKFRPDAYEAFTRILQNSFGVKIEERAEETLLQLGSPDATP